jgi:hypothetical protein
MYIAATMAMPVQRTKPILLAYRPAEARPVRFDFPAFFAAFAFCGVAVVLFNIIIPRFGVMLQNFQTSLPACTLWLLQVSQWSTRGYCLILLAPLLTFPLLIARWREGARHTSDSIRLMIRLTTLAIGVMMAIVVFILCMPIMALVNTVSK